MSTDTVLLVSLGKEVETGYMSLETMGKRAHRGEKVGDNGLMFRHGPVRDIRKYLMVFSLCKANNSTSADSKFWIDPR